MEAIVTVEFRFSHAFKYTSHYRGMEFILAPAFGTPLWFYAFTNKDGETRTILDQCGEESIVESILEAGGKPLFMKWCMEESREFGFNPFVTDVKRLVGQPHLVYITHDINDDLIKVGTTAHLKKRLRALYSRKGHKYKVLGLMQGSFNTEYAVHQRFKEHLVMGREWFRPHKDIFDFMETYTFSPDGFIRL